MKADEISGVSECIIMGQSMSIGTGAMKVVRPLEIEVGLGDRGVEGLSFGDAVRPALKARQERLKARRAALVGAAA
jgi:DNA-directed RNA polymerase III subunit RPC1